MNLEVVLADGTIIHTGGENKRSRYALQYTYKEISIYLGTQRKSNNLEK